MATSDWLWAEMERAAEDYAQIPVYLRPVITAENALLASATEVSP